MITRTPENSVSTTRYLCVTARTDERFADSVLDGLLVNHLRGAEPSTGFELAPVSPDGGARTG